MKKIKLLLAALVLLANTGVGAIASADDVISSDALAAGTYCHEKFPAIAGESLPSHEPVLKGTESGDIIDYYGPCDENPAGKSQVQEQKLDFQHHYVTEFLLGGE